MSGALSHVGTFLLFIKLWPQYLIGNSGMIVRNLGGNILKQISIMLQYLHFCQRKKADEAG
jgi:hypothetical protein